ncbi:MAG: Xaa-Pro peptidase family protein, partial [Chloroflexota bacterium]
MSHLNRQQRIKQALIAENLDAALILSPVGTCYLSGCYLLTQTVIPEREAYVLITKNGDMSYLVCNIEEASARHHSHIDDVHIYVEFADVPALAAAQLLEEKGLSQSRIGIELHTMSAATLRHLEQSLAKAEFVPWDTQFAKTLMIKDSGEVDALETAGRATQQAIVDGLTGAAVGSSELDVANRILQGIMDAGIVPLFNVFAAGPNLLQAHAEATNRLLQPGEIVRLDMGGRLASNNYLSDMARTAVVGTPSTEQQQIYAALADIQQAIMEACRPGQPISALYHLCATRFEAHGLPFGMPHIGHGMGIGLHESPMIHPKNE